MIAGAATGRRCADPRPGRHVLKLGPGEHLVSQQPDALLLTVLGSCVAACIRDPVAGVGGMNHFMLPESADGRWGRAAFSLRYGNFAMERLINDLFNRGGRRERLEAKVFGGARIGQDFGAIGDRNAAFVEDYLKAEGIVPVVRELRGRNPRRIAYLPVSGRAFMVELPCHEARVADADRHFRKRLRRAPPSGSVELFPQ